jgi:hypothetical protein
MECNVMKRGRLNCVLERKSCDVIKILYILRYMWHRGQFVMYFECGT